MSPQTHADESDTQPFETILQDNIGNQIALSGAIGSNGFIIDSEVYAPGYDNSDSKDTREVKENVRTAVKEATGGEITAQRRDDCHLNGTPQEFLQNTRSKNIGS